jgi:hypothetical protein
MRGDRLPLVYPLVISTGTAISTVTGTSSTRRARVKVSAISAGRTWDGIQFADRTIPYLPIATAEIQGYGYDA